MASAHTGGLELLLRAANLYGIHHTHTYPHAQLEVKIAASSAQLAIERSQRESAEQDRKAQEEMRIRQLEAQKRDAQAIEEDELKLSMRQSELFREMVGWISPLFRPIAHATQEAAKADRADYEERISETKKKQVELQELRELMDKQRIEEEVRIQEEISRREKEFDTRIKAEQARADREAHRRKELERLVERQRLQQEQADLERQSIIQLESEHKLQEAIKALSTKDEEIAAVNDVDRTRIETELRLEKELVEQEMRTQEAERVKIESAFSSLKSKQ